MSEHYNRLQLDIDTNEPESTPYVKRLVTALVSSSVVWGNAAGQQAKSELVGTWTPVAIYTQQKDGTKFETFGPKPIGVLTFSDDGRFSLQWMRSGLPQFACGDRQKGTEKENQAIVQGSLSYFGTYTVDESSNTLVLHIEGSTFPNWNGKDQKRSFTLAGDKLTLSGIGTSGLPFQDELQWLK